MDNVKSETIIEEIKTEQALEDLLKKEAKVCVYFWAPWCGPCRTFKHTYEKVAASCEGVKFVKINVDDNNESATKYQIRSIPNLLMFKNNSHVNSRIGSLTESELRNFVNC